MSATAKSNGRAKSAPAAGAAPARTDAVFIRKSSDAQDEYGQKANVEALLHEAGVHVPEANWFTCTVPRADVQGNKQFARLMGMVNAGRVGTVYIESQDR